MSLDVHLTLDGEEVYWANITHNLNQMADKAGIYEALWHPENIIGVKKAIDIIPIVEAGLHKLVSQPSYFKQFDAPNGWGTYKDFVPWVIDYLEALKNHPEADVYTST